MPSVNVKRTLALPLRALLTTAGTASAASFSVIGIVPGGPLHRGSPRPGGLWRPAVLTVRERCLVSQPVAHTSCCTVSTPARMADGPNIPESRSIKPAIFMAQPESGGANSGGTVWKFSTSGGTMTTLYTLGATGDGAQPFSGAVHRCPGRLVYGSVHRRHRRLWRSLPPCPSGARTTLYKIPKSPRRRSLSGIGRRAQPIRHALTAPRWAMAMAETRPDRCGGVPPSGALKTLYVFQNGTDGE